MLRGYFSFSLKVRNKSFELFKVLLKGKGVPLHAMEARGGRGGVAPAHT
jgi:hypothetical protein